MLEIAAPSDARFAWPHVMPTRHSPWRRPLSRAMVACLLLAPAAGHAHDAGTHHGTPRSSLAAADPLQRTIDDIVRPAIASQAIPAITVAVSQNGVRRYFTYAASGPRIERDAIVEIGSITKVFTTALVAEAVAAGRMSLDAPMQSYLPRLQLSACAAQVTARQLADFTSGMPTLPDNLPPGLRNRGIDHYSERDFLQWVARWNPSTDGHCTAPATYSYSNASVGLLGHMVANAMQTPWRDLVAQQITGPLGMIDTAIEVSPQHRSRLAQGHGPLGAAVIPWPVFAWFAAGALRSTPQDMMRFSEAALGHAQVEGRAVPPALSQAFLSAMTPIYQPDGKPFLQALSWAVRPATSAPGSRPVALKDGGTDGFNSVIVVSADTNVAVFVVANKAQSGVPALGVAIARAIPAAARTARLGP